MSTEVDCVKKKKKQFDTLCKQWGELLSSWINWSATDFRQVIQLVNWRLSDIKQPKWCRFFGRRIFFATCFAKWSFFVPKIFFLRIWRQWRPVARTLIETSEGYWSIGMLGKEMGYEISTCQMQYDAELTRKQIKKIHVSYTLEGTDHDNIESIKYLGVTITSDLRWNTHVSNVCTKANRTLGILRRNLYSCPQEIKEAALM